MMEATENWSNLDEAGVKPHQELAQDFRTGSHSRPDVLKTADGSDNPTVNCFRCQDFRNIGFRKVVVPKLKFNLDQSTSIYFDLDESIIETTPFYYFIF